MGIEISDEEIKSNILRAINITSDVKEPFRLKAFEIVLLSLMRGISPKVTDLQQKATGSISTKDEKIKALAAKCNLTLDELKNVFEFEENKAIVVIRSDGNEGEKQVLVSRLLMVAFDEIYDQEWLRISPLLGEHGIKALAHVAENLEKSGLFLKRGGTTNTQYKLVSSAKTDTYKVICQLGKKGTNIDKSSQAA